MDGLGFGVRLTWCVGPRAGSLLATGWRRLRAFFGRSVGENCNSPRKQESRPGLVPLTLFLQDIVHLERDADALGVLITSCLAVN